MRVESTKLRKGDVVVTGSWVGVVHEATRGKLFREYATVPLLDVFGFEHEMGSAYVADLKTVGNRSQSAPQPAGVAVFDVVEDNTYLGGLLASNGHSYESLLESVRRATK